MKKIITLLLCAALSLGLLAGCGAEEPTQTTNPPSTAADVSQTTAPDAKVEVLRIGTTAAISGSNVMTENGIFGKLNYNAVVTAPFVVTDSEGKVQPFFMTDWQISDDNNTIKATFATDQGITWHDGKPVTMEDVKFTFENLIERKSGYCPGLVSVEVTGDNTATLTLEDGKAFTTINSMANFVYVYPAHVWKDMADQKSRTEYTGEDASIGCGPYKLVSMDEAAQTMTLEAVADTYLGREVTVQKLVVRTYDSHDALVMALRTGEVDAMYDYSNSLDATMAASVTAVADLDAGMSTNPGNYQLVFGFNETPTSDLAFRKAVRSALDYELLRVAIGGENGVIPSTGIVAPPNKGFDDSLPKLAQNQQEAMKMLDEAGYRDTNGDGVREMPDGSPLKVLLTPQFNKTRQALYLRIAEIVMKNLKEVGVDAELDEESVRNSDHANEVRKSGRYQIYIGYTSPGVAMYDSCFMYMIGNNGNNPWGTCLIPEFVEAYEAKKRAGTYEAYDAAMKSLQQINDREVVGLALCWDNAYFPYRTDKYEGWTNYPGWGVINHETWFNLHPAA